MTVIFPAFLLAAVLAGQNAPSIILGTTQAERCYELAQDDATGRASSLRTCREALDDPRLSRRDRAATLNNLGILERRAGNTRSALQHYENAMALAPDLGDSWINRGAVHLSERRPAAAIEDFTYAIDLGTGRLHIAHYNRARAHEWLENYPAAYADYQRAVELAPDWALPQRALERFVVTREPEG